MRSFNKKMKMKMEMKKEMKMKMEMEMKTETAGDCIPWGDLPEELLDLICNKLTDVSDYVRFGAVCKSWRSAAIPTNLGLQVPLLLFPHDTNSSKLTFLNCTSKSVYTFDFPEICGKGVVGSSYGWLVISDSSTMFLFNPLTRSQIQLPPATRLPDGGYGQVFTRRAFLSSSPSSDDCIVMVIFKGFSKFAFCRPADRAWTMVHTSLPRYIAAITYHKKQFFIIDFEGNTAICNDSSASRPTLIPTLKVPDTNLIGGSELYMVNTSGGHELLLVASHKVNYEARKTDYCVLKLDKLKWSMAGSIGQDTLFLSSRECSCISIPNSAWAPDSIYFPINWFCGSISVLGIRYEICRFDVPRKNVLKDEISGLVSNIWKDSDPVHWLWNPQWFIPTLN